MTEKQAELYGLTSEQEVLEVINNPALKIEFVRIMFPDILGRPMDFSIPSSELERAFSEGKGFDWLFRRRFCPD